MFIVVHSVKLACHQAAAACLSRYKFSSRQQPADAMELTLGKLRRGAHDAYKRECHLGGALRGPFNLSTILKQGFILFLFF